MHELFQFYPQLDKWQSQNKGIAIATVTATWGSAPRRPGAIMAITDDMQMIGSVSAGCVESAVIEEAQAVIKSQHPKALHYGITDEIALDVGLACGGEINIYLQPYPQELHAQIADYIQAEQAFSWHSIETENSFQQFLSTETINYPVSVIKTDDASTTVIQKISPPLNLIIVGGNHIAVALSQLAKVMGYGVILIDPRMAFATKERFQQVDHILNDYPHRVFPQININSSTAIAILAHDPKIDDIALELALQSSAFYVGALGGRKTQHIRRERLKQMGLSSQQIERLHAPIGLSIGAETPEQIALSILAEIVAIQNTGG